MRPLVVFTDLDGTLLDHNSYSVRPAVPALDLLVRRGCPVIPVSSKTAAEIRYWMKLLTLEGPFICENGCGIVIPADCFREPPAGAHYDGTEYRYSLGIDVGRVRMHLREMKRDMGLDLRGFEEMGEEEISGLTGLTGDELHLSREREYDEPFVSAPDLDAAALRKEAAARGLTLTRGGRFFHLTGNCDKGLAVKKLGALYRKDRPDALLIAIGDSENDIPMFREVDRAFLVQKPDGSYDPSIAAELAVSVPAAGPVGFRQVIEGLMAELGGRGTP